MSNQNDPLRIFARLDKAMGDDRLKELETDSSQAGAEACAAALEVAVALGWCHLTRMNPDKSAASLSPAIALAATTQLAQQAELWTSLAASMGDRWDAAKAQSDKNDILASLLNKRMDAWAASEAIQRTIETAFVNNVPEAHGLVDADDEATAAIGRFDDALYQERSLLSAVLDTNLIGNWRTALADEYREKLPWWLDGTLEQEAKRVEQEALAMMPSPEAWAARFGQHHAAPVLLKYPAAAWLPAASPLRAAAAGAGEARLARLLRWRRGDGRFEAVLGLSDQYAPSAELVVSFLKVETDEPAVELAGQTVKLAGMDGSLGADGYARFSHETVWQSGEAAPTLEVDGELWKALESDAD